MKIKEIQNKEMPHLYLDMDGVQADLFNRVAEIEKVKSWDDITDQNKAITNISLQGPEKVYDLFRNLEPLQGGKIIVKWLKDNNIPFTVLSAPLRNEPEASIEAKKDWLDQYNPNTSQSAKFTKQKFLYAVTNGTPNVLVDDFDYYLDSWNKAGGIGIKHKDSDTNRTIEKLEKIFRPYLNK